MTHDECPYTKHKNPGDENLTREWDPRATTAYINAHAPSLHESKRQLNKVARSNYVIANSVRGG